MEQSKNKIIKSLDFSIKQIERHNINMLSVKKFLLIMNGLSSSQLEIKKIKNKIKKHKTI
jgi:hypothetical protein